MYKRSFAIAILCIPFTCFANSTYTGEITRIHAGPSVGTKVYLTLETDQNNKSSCSTNTSYNYVFDTAANGGESVLSMALTAYTSGKEVNIGGYQTCNLSGNTEDLKY